jgi:chitinase
MNWKGSKVTFIKTFSFLILLLLVSFILGSYTIHRHSKKGMKNSSFRVVAYFRGDIKEVQKYDYQKVTHLIYCFMYLKGNQIGFKNEDSENTLKECLALKKKYPKLKVLIALGGWGGCETCSSVFSSNEARIEFAHSVQDVLVKYKADGIDIDWESPVIGGFKDHKAAPEDKENFTQLIFTLRKTLSKRFEICFDANSTKDFIDQSIDWKKVLPKVNFVNLMTYGLPTDKRGHTGHHTALFSSPLQSESIDKSIKYLDSLGLPKNKFLIGAAFYSFVVKEVDSLNNGLGQKGKFKSNVNYNNLNLEYTEVNGYKYFWDTIACAPYLYNPDQKMFVTFDDKHSVSLKTKYAFQNHLGGIMFWRLNGDFYSDGLLDAIDLEIKKLSK